ncbi:MAG: DUF4124 domain-containing protein [Kangiellaceae bacterium]|nr:DUF4124 domain-containing protein [Kangiellaceae bacterium]
MIAIINRNYLHPTRLILVVTLICSSLSLTVSSKEIHQWTDSSGRIHFSDMPPQDISSIQFQRTEVQQVKLIKTPEIKFLKMKKVNKSRKRKTSAVSACSKIKSQISDIEKSLVVKQKAAEFDRKNRQLQQLRWKKIKSC